MKKINTVFLILWFLIASNFCIAQITFKKKFVQGGGAGGLYLFELSNHNFFTGLAFNSGISHLDSVGNILYQHTYATDSFLVLAGLKHHINNVYYFTANYYRDSCAGSPNLYPVIGKMDSLGNILSAHYYHINPDCHNLIGGFDISNDGGVISGGHSGYSFYIFKTDSNGNYIWSKHFFGRNGGVTFVKALPDNSFLFGLNLDTAGAAVAKLDSAGNFIWCKSYFRPRGFVHDCIIDYDGSYLITGYTDSVNAATQFPPYPPWLVPKYFMMKLDTSGSVLWCKGYDSNNHWLMKQGSQIINTLDGNRLIYATVITPYSYVPILIKTDVNGDTLWTRVHYASQNWYTTSSIIATSDSGYLFDGIIHPFAGGGDVFLYKTDSLGHTYCNEQYEPIYVYNLFPTDSDFTLSSVSGGYGLPAFANNIIYPMPTVSTECITGVGTVSSGSPWRGNFSLFPNPSSGKVHIYRQDPYLSNCYYSVYNTQGHLLIQQKLISGDKDTTIDLSKHGKGIYLIKITDGVEVVTKKVVLE